jgi:hypothetical protein
MYDENDDSREEYQNLPIFKKGREIMDTVRSITDLFPEENEMLQSLKQNLLADSALLTVKVAGASAGDLYDIRMEAAAIIRKAANDLMVSYHSLKNFGFKEVDYYHIVRDQLEEYRLLFIDWVAGFDKWNYVIDRWGLFNPPGVGPFDKDPDEDIPMSDDFFDGDEE